MKNGALILAVLLTLSACKKNHGTSITLNGMLTDCFANSVCNNNYYNNADFSTTDPRPVPGQYIVFAYSGINNNVCGPTHSLLFKAPEGSDSFDITSNQIASGEISGTYVACPCCDNFALNKPIGGEIKGQRTDNTHWLINATVFFGYSATIPADTLTVNQYFTVKSLQ